MRKLLWIVMIVVFAMWGLSGCGGSEEVVASEQISEESGKNAEEVVASGENVEEAETEAAAEEVADTEVVVVSEEKVERVADADGINLGNIANSNFWSFQGNELFYTANYDVGIYNLETGDLSKVENHGGNNSYVVGNDLYFSHITGIRRADLSTGEYVQLSNSRANYINVHEDWVYFVNSMDNDTIYRMKTDGSEPQQLSILSSVRCLIQYDGYLYFNPYSEYNKLYRMKLDGSELVMINDQWVPFFMIYDGKLYMSQHGEYGIFRSELDGSGKTKLTDYYGDFFNITSDNVFYNNAAENYQLYRMKIDGSENELWLEQSVVYMCVNDGYLYFFNEKDAERRVHRMRYDSKELELMNLPSSI
ncbi:MAG: DUF5050 domain-containing protein [Clostridiales bacterium]|nr:DUF5050 domain-containing protein [Clostridiales bacterium]